MSNELPIPTADSKYFQVFDGMYTSELFEVIDDACDDARACSLDESFSGSAVVCVFELCDAGQAGRCLHRYEAGGRRINLDIQSPYTSSAVRELYEKHSARLNGPIDTH